MRARLASVVVAAMSAVVMLFAIGASSASASFACMSIKGVGSSLQKNAQILWAADWSTGKGAEECTTAQTVEYKATSSGNGKKQWGDAGGKLKEFESTEQPLAAFIGTDNAASASQMEKMSEAGGQEKTLGIVTVPVAQSGISIMVTLPKECMPETTTGSPEISDVALGEEFEKGTSTFLSLLHNKILGSNCDNEPTVFVRSSNSGTTTGVKHYFSNSADTMTAEWLRLGASLEKAESSEWPNGTGDIESSGNLNKCCATGQELVEKTHTTAGSIGYADYSDSHGSFKTTWEEHGGLWSGLAKIGVESGGSYVSVAEGSEEASNCKSAKYKGESTKKVEPGVDWSTAAQENVNNLGIYPLCTLTYDLAWHNYLTTVLEEPSNYGSALLAGEIGSSVLSYLKYITGTKGQEALKKEHYAEIPSGIKTKDASGVNETNIKR